MGKLTSAQAKNNTLWLNFSIISCVQLKQQQQFYQSGQLPAMSLVETIVAMVIVTVAFAGGMLLFLNITQNEQTQLKTEASVYLQSLMTQTKQEHRYFDESFENTGFVATKTITPYGLTSQNFLLSLQATDHQGKILHKLREVIYYPLSKQ